MKKLKRQYAPTEIAQAAQTYFISGSLVKTAEMTNIPRTTLQSWKDRGAEQWVQRYDEVRQEKRAELDSHYTAILDKSTAELRDRLDNGDEYYDAKTGQKYRKRISGRDLATINGICFDKQQLLRGLPTSSTTKISLEDNLKRIAAELSKHAGPRPKSVNVIEGFLKRLNEESEG